jgi:hypothetical protein
MVRRLRFLDLTGANAMRRVFTALAFAAFAVFAAGPALAGGLYKDHVHADSYGNLVIHSPAGYKRIIVGMGHTAEAYNVTGSYYEPEGPAVVYLEQPRRERQVRRCSRPPHIWHGRSRMYGLPEGVIPQAPLVCE